MENKKSTEFKTLMDYAKAMHSRYFHALSAFYAYEAMKEGIWGQPPFTFTHLSFM